MKPAATFKPPQALNKLYIWKVASRRNRLLTWRHQDVISSIPKALTLLQRHRYFSFLSVNPDKSITSGSDSFWTHVYSGNINNLSNPKGSIVALDCEAYFSPQRDSPPFSSLIDETEVSHGRLCLRPWSFSPLVLQSSVERSPPAPPKISALACILMEVGQLEIFERRRSRCARHVRFDTFLYVWKEAVDEGLTWEVTSEQCLESETWVELI